MANGVIGQIGEASRAANSLAPVPASPAAALADAPVHMLRALLADPDAQTTLNTLLQDDPDMAAVTSWLGQLQLLLGVPFVYLIADARMLPPESMRFFYLDNNWIGAMTDGALALGLGTSRDLALLQALTEQIEQGAAASALASRAQAMAQPIPGPASGPRSGVLIRSALASGWPGLTVTVTAKEAVVPVLRIDHLSNDVMIVLFNGVPDTVTLAEPHEGLEFGVNNRGEIATRVVTNSTVQKGKEIVLYPRDASALTPTLRNGGLRVLNINIDPSFPSDGVPSTAADLLGMIAQALAIGTKQLSVATFAVQLVKGPEELTFSLNPPAYPK